MTTSRARMIAQDACLQALVDAAAAADRPAAVAEQMLSIVDRLSLQWKAERPQPSKPTVPVSHS